MVDEYKDIMHEDNEGYLQINDDELENVSTEELLDIVLDSDSPYISDGSYTITGTRPYGAKVTYSGHCGYISNNHYLVTGGNNPGYTFLVRSTTWSAPVVDYTEADANTTFAGTPCYYKAVC